MEIVIYSLNHTIVLNVNYNSSILDVKNMIFEKTGIIIDLQDLVSSYRYMKNYLTLGDYNIHCNSKITLKVNPMEIQIKTMTNESILINVAPYRNINFIKAEIKIKLGIPETQQKLLYKNRLLKDQEELYALREKNPTLLLFSNRPYIKIAVNTPFRNTLVLDVASDTGVNDVMVMIKNKLGINEDKQELIYKNVMLENTKTLSDYKISNESTLHLSVKECDFKISIKTMTSKLFELDVNLYETIGKIKAKIETIERVSPEKQILIFSFGELDDSKTIEEYKIMNISVLYLLERRV